MRRILAIVSMLVGLALAGLPPVPAVGAVEHVEQVTVFMPFEGNWANQFGTAPWEHGNHTNQDWAMDLFAADRAVRIEVGEATGAVSINVIEVVRDSTCGNAGGTYVTVDVAVDGRSVGTVLYHHLVDVRVAEGDTVASGAVLGRTVSTPQALSGPCWHVNTEGGIHTHLAVRNTTGQSCYVRYDIGRPLHRRDPIAMLGHHRDGHSVGTGPRSECASDDRPRCRGHLATIVGTAGHDQLVGTAGPDVIVGMGGRDTIVAGDGDDIICGGSGADTIDAGAGDDQVNGGLTDDVVIGGPGDDVLVGGRQNDLLHGDDGNDRLSGGDGDDVVHGGAGDDKALGYGGNDTLLGGAGRDRLFGGDGDDVLRGGAAADAMAGRAGHDRCLGGADLDRAHHTCEVVARRP